MYVISILRVALAEICWLNVRNFSKFWFYFQGKGTIVTYFLAGYEGFTKQLPDLSQAASLEEHSFKWRGRKSNLNLIIICILFTSVYPISEEMAM